MDSKIIIVKSHQSWIESNAIDQLKHTAELKGIIKAVGLPDLHVGKTPVGACFVTRDILYPHIVGNDIGCGMALFSTGIKKSKFKIHRTMIQLEKLDGLENVTIDHLIKDVTLPFQEKLGTIGSGNHFAELQEVDKIYDEEALREIHMDRSSIYLLVHSGSRNFGEHILRKYVEQYSCQHGLPVGSIGLEEYMKEHETAVQYARLNRELIAYRILEAIHGKDGAKLLDSVHNGISEKEVNGETCYIHRKGAAPSDIGYVVVAGSRGTSSYIVKPREGLVEYGFSISHGAGRKWPRFGCKEKLEKVYTKKALRENQRIGNLVYREKSVIFEEAPEAYKNIDRVIEDMLENEMVELVATLKPLITYKV